MTRELEGKAAIVTGAGRNIGRAIALALAEAGASIVVNARSNRAEADAVAREIEALGCQALVHIGDVADATAVHGISDKDVASAPSFGRGDRHRPRRGSGAPTCRPSSRSFRRPRPPP